MLKQVIGKKIVELDSNEFSAIVQKYSHIVVDLGTGDGKFAYHFAKANPEAFVIGIDAAAASMEEVSHKASRKPAKGGLDNVIFIQAAAEQLPQELTGIAHEVYVNFPWGSLLTGVAKAEPQVMQNLVRICHPQAEINIFLSYDTKFEPELLAQAQLPELSLSYFRGELNAKYGEFGLAVIEADVLTHEQKQQLTSSWPKKILSQRERDIYYLRCGIISPEVTE